MEQYKIGKATVRIHGQCDQDNLKSATVSFLKKAEEQRKRRSKADTAKKPQEQERVTK